MGKGGLARDRTPMGHSVLLGICLLDTVFGLFIGRQTFQALQITDRIAVATAIFVGLATHYCVAVDAGFVFVVLARGALIALCCVGGFQAGDLKMGYVTYLIINVLRRDRDDSSGDEYF
eukprot:gene209-145_t